jgi:sterol 14alpha-demethylase
MRQCGDVFTILCGGQRLTFLVGPKAHDVFFEASDEELSQNEPYSFSVPLFGPNVIYDTSLARRLEQIKFVTDSLHIKALDNYVPKMIDGHPPPPRR